MAHQRTLLTLIAEMGLATPQQLDEVQARQIIYGGNEELNLIELGLVDEAQLLRVLSRLTELPSAGVGYLDIHGPLTSQLLSTKPLAAVQLGEDRDLIVYRSEHCGPDWYEEVTEALGSPLQTFIASTVRLKEAVAFAEGTTLPLRIRKVLEGWGARPTADVALTHHSSIEVAQPPASVEQLVSEDRSPSDLQPTEGDPFEVQSPPAPDIAPNSRVSPSSHAAELEEDPSSALRPVSARASPLDEKDTASLNETAPPPEGYADITAALEPQDLSKLENHGGSPRHTYAPVEATEDLRGAKSRDRIIDVLVHFAAQFFDYTAVFAVQKNDARGLKASGDGTTTALIKNLRIPLDLPSAFREARDTSAHRLARLKASGLEGGIARDLGRPTGKSVFLLPILVRRRTLLLLWGDRGDENVDLNELGELFEFTPQISEALEQVVVDLKKASRIVQPLGSSVKSLRVPTPSETTNEEISRINAPSRRATNLMIPKPGATRSGAKSLQKIGEAPPRPTFHASEPPKPHLDTWHNGAPPAAATASGDEDGSLRGNQPRAEGSHETTSPDKRSFSTPPGLVKRNEDSQRPVRFPSSSPKTLRGLSPIDRFSTQAIMGSKFGPQHSTTEVDTGPPTEVDPLLPQSHDEASPAPLLSRRMAPLNPPHESSLHTRQSDVQTNSSLPPPQVLDTNQWQDNAVPLEHLSPLGNQPILDDEPAFEQTPNIVQELSVHDRPTVEHDSPTVEHHRTSNTDPQPIDREQHASPANSTAQAELDSELVSTKNQSYSSEVAPDCTPAEQVEYPFRRSGSTLLSRRPPPPIQPFDEGDVHPPPSGELPEDLASTSRTSLSTYPELVQALLRGEEAALRRLIDGGESAVGALIEEFPGPVNEPADAQAPASSCGPILHALVEMGTKSTPFLTVRTADEDPEVRRWATFTLGELPGKDSAKAIAGRLLDDDLSVRRSALKAARRLRSNGQARRILRAEIENMCRDHKLHIEDRSSAVEVLSDIREHEAIPTLLHLLEDEDRSLSRASRWALSVLTRQDFGTDISAWQEFWQLHRDEDRVDWLILSLNHQEKYISRAAAEELRSMANNDFGYLEEQAESARREVQARFRQWWQLIGKAASLA